MIKNIDLLKSEISNLDIPGDKKNEIINIANKINKDIVKAEYRTEMLRENANTSKTLLNNIISEIDKKNSIIQEINEELEAADEELRQNNEELQLLNENIFNQKNVIEEKEQRLETIIENQGEGFGITDFDENFTFTNSMACTIFNVPKGKLTGRNLREFLDDRELEEIKKESEKRKQNIHSNYELKIRLDDKTEKTLLVTTAPDYNEKKEIVGTIGTFQDITERKKKQNKLKQLNNELNKYFTAVEQSPLTIVLTDTKGKIEYVNSRFTKKTGYSFKEVKGKTPAILKSGQTPEKTYTKLWNTILAGDIWKGEFINKSKMGDLFVERAVISPIRDNTGNIINYVSLKEDITELKKTEQALIDSENRFKAFSQATSEALLITENGICIDANEIASEMFGYTHKQMMGMAATEFIAPESLDLAKECMLTNNAKPYDAIVQHKDGTKFYAEIQGRMFEYQKKKVRIAAIRDISTRKKAEQAIKVSEEKYRILFEKSNDAILLIGRNKFIDCNASAVELFGYKSKKELVKMHPSNISPEKQACGTESFEKAEEMMKLAYKKGNNKFEWIHKRANGDIFPAEVWLTAIPYKDKPTIHAVVRDLTERKNAELKLKLQKEKIENAHKSITDSIDYAKRIQQALLPTERTFKESFSDHFIIYEPRDVVSGDFYWAKKINFLTSGDDGIVFAIADCTGHGVPGAFLSMLGISFLNEIVRTLVVENAGDTLNYLRKMVKSALRQTGGFYEQKDGMDIVFCTLNKRTLELIYAGANNPLYIIRERNSDNNELYDQSISSKDNSKISVYSILDDNQSATKDLQQDAYNYELIEIRPDKQPIGVHLEEKQFTSHEIQLQKGDILYAFSDGYADQFNGITNKKFKSFRFKNLLLSIANQPLNEQKEILEQTFKNWKGDMNQVDDVLILSVKI